MFIIITLFVFTFNLLLILSKEEVVEKKPPLDITKQFGVTLLMYNVLG